MRMRSSATADDLREDAVHGIWMDEGHLEAEQAAPGRLVDQLCTLGGELVERRADIVDLVGDVVHAGPALGQELPDRRVVAERGQQLDAVGADAQRRGLDALVGNRLAGLEPRAEEPLVRRERAVEVVDGNSEVVNPARLHAGDAICSVCGRVSRPLRLEPCPWSRTSATRA